MWLIFLLFKRVVLNSAELLLVRLNLINRLYAVTYGKTVVKNRLLDDVYSYP
jgi:hypothetical protein